MSRSDHLQRLVSDLTPIEIFDFYDGPRFYSCRDVAGQLFLVYWIEEIEGGSSWLYLRISPDRYNALKNGLLTIAFALSHPEEGYAFVVNSLGQDFSVEEISAQQIAPDWLPPVDDRLSLDSPSLPPKISSAVDVARRVNRQVFDVAFEKASNKYEIGCGKLGRVLESLQNTVYAFACGFAADVTRVPEETKARSEMLVTGVFASSFGVRLQSKAGDLFGDDQTVSAIHSLGDLISLLNSPEDIVPELHRFNILARSRFKHFLRVLIDSEVSIKTDWGSPDGSSRQAHAGFQKIALALKYLDLTDQPETRTATRPGRLVGVDVQSDLFVLVTEEKDVIKGRLSDRLATRNFEVPSLVVAEIEETCVIDPLTDRQKWSYVLIDLK